MLQSVAQIARTARAEIDVLEHDMPRDCEVAAEQEPGELGLARRADARHWAAHKRPIAADTLRVELKISMDRARELVMTLRAELANVVVERAGIV